MKLLPKPPIAEIRPGTRRGRTPSISHSISGGSPVYRFMPQSEIRKPSSALGVTDEGLSDIPEAAVNDCTPVFASDPGSTFCRMRSSLLFARLS